MWSLPRWKRKIANKKFYAKHFKKSLVSSSSDDSDDDRDDEQYASDASSNSHSTLTSPGDFLSPVLSPGTPKSVHSSLWQQMSSKIRANVRNDTPGGAAALLLREPRNDAPSSPVLKRHSSMHERNKNRMAAAKNKRRHRSNSDSPRRLRRGKNRSNLAVVSFSSEDSSDNEHDVRVSALGGHCDNDLQSSSTDRLGESIVVQDDEMDILYSDHEAPWSWQRGDLIGKGQYGTVFLAKRIDDNTQKMAMKEVELLLPRSILKSLKHGEEDTGRSDCEKMPHHRKHNDQKSPETLLALLSLVREITVMQKLKHPNIVRYLGFEKRSVDPVTKARETSRREDDEYEEGGVNDTRCKLRLFMEFVGGGSIAGLLKRLGPFCEQVVVAYAKQILAGLHYLHSNGVAHRDIKGANLLLTTSGTIKLADFGAATALQQMTPRSRSRKRKKGGESFSKFQLEQAVGTPHWMAPEVARGMGTSRKEYLVWEKADIWSVGCTIIEMCSGKAPWYKQFSNPIAIIFHLANKATPPEYPTGLSGNLIDFLDRCFIVDATQRPSTRRLLPHAVMQGIDNEMYPPSKLQMLSPLYAKKRASTRRLLRKPSSKLLLQDQTSNSETAIQLQKDTNSSSSITQSNDTQNLNSTETSILLNKESNLIEKTRIGPGISRNENSSRGEPKVQGGQLCEVESASKLTKQDADDNLSVPNDVEEIRKSIVKDDMLHTESVCTDKSVKASEDNVGNGDNIPFESELDTENYDNSFLAWLFGHVDWVCVQAVSYGLMTKQQYRYLLDPQYANWDLRQTPASPLLAALQSVADEGLSLIDNTRYELGMSPLGIAYKAGQAPDNSPSANLSDATEIVGKSMVPTQDHGLVDFAWNYRAANRFEWDGYVKKNLGGLLSTWLDAARDNLEFDRHVPTWLLQLRRRCLYVARLQQCYERLEHIIYCFNNLLDPKDVELAKKLQVGRLVDRVHTMKLWLAYPNGDAYALLHTANIQVHIYYGKHFILFC